MKKTLIISVLALLFTATTALAKPSVEYLRVGINYGADSVSQYILNSESGFIAGTDDDRVFTQGTQIDATSITVTISDDGIITYGENTFDTSSGQRLTIMPKSGFLTNDSGKQFRGGLQFLNSGAGKLTVVNFLTVDDYVKGVVPREMPASWNIEALKAQAVCARNYVISNCNKHKSAGFDVCTGVHCQVYGGMSGEYESSNRAVDETKGQYLMYGSSLAETLFFSSSGGHTGNAKYVWGNAVPYLCGSENEFEDPSENSRYRWSFTKSLDEITQIMSSKGYTIGQVTSISCKTDETTGQIYELTVHGTDSDKTFKNDSTRGWIGGDLIKSQFYTVTPITEQGDIYALSSDGTSKISSFAVTGKNGNVLSASMPLSAISATHSVTYNANITGYRFDGRGWGHGLGLSQYGAKGMADQGYGYEEILYHFYPGTVLE